MAIALLIIIVIIIILLANGDIQPSTTIGITTLMHIMKSDNVCEAYWPERYCRNGLRKCKLELH